MYLKPTVTQMIHVHSWIMISHRWESFKRWCSPILCNEGKITAVMDKTCFLQGTKFFVKLCHLCMHKCINDWCVCVCACVLMMFFNFMYVLLFIKYFRISPNKIFPFFACYFEPKLGKHLNRLFICCTGEKNC